MRLADFIASNIEPILVQWDAFAATQLPAAASMQPRALRDHARQILEAAVRDLRTHQTRDAQTAKSKGLAIESNDAPETAAQTHAVLRAKSGFLVTQLVAEYRALRASVLRLWTDSRERIEKRDFDDMIRFNEAIDQAVAESVDFYSAQIEQARDLSLGVLGHDLRSPLQTIHLTARYLSALNAGNEVSIAAARLVHSGSRMQSLLDDLVDYNRTALGLGIRIVPTEIDAGTVLAVEVDRLRTVHPQRHLVLETTGDCRGAWDGARLQQLFCNLVQNAVQHGGRDTPVVVVVRGDPNDIVVSVKNQGPAVDGSVLCHVFDPFRRGSSDSGERDEEAGNLGLGLYIARQIAVGHGGHIDARSDANETVFSVRLPRRRPTE